MTPDNIIERMGLNVTQTVRFHRQHGRLVKLVIIKLTGSEMETTRTGRLCPITNEVIFTFMHQQVRIPFKESNVAT